MKTLGIDYGRRKMGLAITDGSLASPWKVLRVNNFDDAIQKIEREIAIEKPNRIVVGISEGEIGEESRKFAKKIGAETFDETLSTKRAQELSKEAKIGRRKSKNLEDAYAACVMLQSYLDSYV